MTDAAHLQAICKHVERNLDSAPELLAGLVALLGDRRAYEVPKTGLTFCLQKHIHDLVLTNPDLKVALTRDRTPFTRHVRSDKYIVIFEGIVPEPDVSSTEYDMCISFAGRDREIAERIAEAVKSNGMNRKVFYDMYERNNLWGADLTARLHDLYSNQSRFCVILFSHSYLERAWTRHELRAVQVRVVQERGEYVLPIELHKGTVPSEFSNVGYWEFRDGDEAEIAEAIEEKIDDFLGEHLTSIDELVDVFNLDFVADIASSEILDQALTEQDESRRQGMTCLALLLAGNITKLLPRYRALIDLIMFSPGLVGDLFGHDNLADFNGLGIHRRTKADIGFSRAWEAIMEDRMPRFDQDNEDEQPGSSEEEPKA